MRNTVLAILDNAKHDGGHAYFGLAKEKRVVRQLAREGIAHVVGTQKDDSITWIVARLA